MLGSFNLFVFLAGIGGGIAGTFTRKRIDDIYQFLKKFAKLDFRVFRRVNNYLSSVKILRDS
jgi:hypothetical protein